MEAQSGRPLAELPWRSRLKDPFAMHHIKPEQVMARFDTICQLHGLCKENS
jgi:heptosyltransferase I